MSRVRYEILAHALERLEERFPNEYPDTDLEAGQLIQQEVEAGLAQGRWGRVAPDGFCLEGPNRWTDEFVWTPSGPPLLRDPGLRLEGEGDHDVGADHASATAGQSDRPAEIARRQAERGGPLSRPGPPYGCAVRVPSEGRGSSLAS